ncbi:MAG: DUF4271 domain-containing protein [Bacteroidetes bacterium]|nr:DUF4271 domain-containing protein [Bacteroidota bacterium]
MLKYLIIWLGLLFCGPGFAQDSLQGRMPDTARSPTLTIGSDLLASEGITDSTLRRRLTDFTLMPAACRTYGPQVGGYMEAHPYFPWLAKPVLWMAHEHRPVRLDWLFYALLACLAYLGLLRRGFPKYFSDLWVAFFDMAIRQSQIREQMSRQAIPSQLINLLFFINTALFLILVSSGLGIPTFLGAGPQLAAWLLTLAVLYGLKYLSIRCVGWLSGRHTEAQHYMFIVMMVNKVLGMLLIPLNIFLAFRGPDQRDIILVFAIGIVGVLALYRFLRCFEFVHRELRVDFLPYLLFFGSFEVMPILVIGKVLFGLFP